MSGERLLLLKVERSKVEETEINLYDFWGKSLR